MRRQPSDVNLRRTTLIAVLFVAAILISLAALVRLFEPRLAFFPSTGESVTPRDYGVDYQPLTVETRDGQKLRGWRLRGAEGRARILYFHGNGGNLSVWAPIVTGIARRGFSVFAFDYRGYGLSTGRPTEQGLYRDVDAIVDQFWASPADGAPVVYWGRSLGVAMATYAATIRKPDGVILEAGFPDARSLIRTSPLLSILGLFSTYRFSSREFLKRLDASVSVLVLHGDDDHVVPLEQGRALFDAVPVTKQFVLIRGGDHNDESPAEPDKYWGAVKEFVGRLTR
jgi:fermentation-respiration switch protein FrsA (DUF1100 family)